MPHRCTDDWWSNLFFSRSEPLSWCDKYCLARYANQFVYPPEAIFLLGPATINVLSDFLRFERWLGQCRAGHQVLGRNRWGISMASIHESLLSPRADSWLFGKWCPYEAYAWKGCRRFYIMCLKYSVQCEIGSMFNFSFGIYLPWVLTYFCSSLIGQTDWACFNSFGENDLRKKRNWIFGVVGD